MRRFGTIDAGQGFADEIQTGFGFVHRDVLPAGVMGHVIADVPYNPQAVPDRGRILELPLEQVGPVLLHQGGDKSDLDGARYIAVIFLQLVSELLRLSARKGTRDCLLQSQARFLAQDAGDEFAHFSAVNV